MVEALVSWTVIGILIAGLIGAGFSVLSMTPPRYRIAEACFAVSALLLWAKFCFWAVTSSATWKERLLVAFLVFGTSGTLLVTVLNWVDGMIPAKAEKSESSVPDRTIEMTYDMNMMGLPLPIQPYTAVTIIQIKDRQKVDALRVQNSEGAVFNWPKQQAGFPPKGIGIIKIANHGTTSVFNVAAVVRFDVGAQKSPGGVSTLNFHLPLIESLRPNDPPYKFYVVDQSSLGGLVFMPDTVDADVPGVGRRTIRVATRKLTFTDNVPMLPPTFPTPVSGTKKKGKRKK